VFGCLADKPIAEMAQILFPLFNRVVLAPVDSPRAASIEAMQQAGGDVAERLETGKDLRDAIALAVGGAGPRRVVLCGSLYLAGAARQLLIDEFQGSEFQGNEFRVGEFQGRTA
jgi:dihydrofolate synthase/folylpolyglutamate synthase